MRSKKELERYFWLFNILITLSIVAIILLNDTPFWLYASVIVVTVFVFNIIFAIKSLKAKALIYVGYLVVSLSLIVFVIKIENLAVISLMCLVASLVNHIDTYKFLKNSMKQREEMKANIRKEMETLGRK